MFLLAICTVSSEKCLFRSFAYFQLGRLFFDAELYEHSLYILDIKPLSNISGFSCGLVVKNLPVSAGEEGSILGLGRSPGEENGSQLQCSLLGKFMDRGACPLNNSLNRLNSMGPQKSCTQLSD